ncbi:uncharacterized protein [Neodiprion pinetum]|uniref:uncharacterized protein isoform X1 n=1 Tax=Neodiprion pinetum TaxID=441929 RepID=UPI001EDF5FB5|nr:uncharacterized protein LOC124222386 isoform X1 [Neodiprion pinetum]
MSKDTKSGPSFSPTQFQAALCAWCWISAICISIGDASSTQEPRMVIVRESAELFRNSYDPRILDGSLKNESTILLKKGNDSNLSATKKISLIRYYMSPKIPNEPIAVVIDTADRFYENVKRLWRIVMAGNKVQENLLLFAYNDTDCKLVRTLYDHNGDAAEALTRIPLSAPGSEGAERMLECVNFALKMVQPDSSILLFTGRKLGNGTFLESTVTGMMSKRCEFNGIWCADKPGRVEEINDYEAIAHRTNGHFLQFTKFDLDQLVTGLGTEPYPKNRPQGSTESNDLDLDINGAILPPEITTGSTATSPWTSVLRAATIINEKGAGDESADLLYDPRINRTKTRVYSARMATAEDKAEPREALELEDMRVASLTAIEQATRLETTTVEITAETSLVGRPGSVSRLIFRVTNNYPLTIRHYFQAKSTSLNVVYLQPRNSWIESGQSLSVVADVLVPSSSTDSTTGTVSLVVQGIDTVEKSTYLYVRQTGSTISDTNKPTITHSFNNNCAGKLESGTCANSLWSVDVTIQDSDSGLQRITSSPIGIRATTSFVSGTKSTTRFQYAATCCQTSVVVTAYDLLGNSNSRTIDVTAWDNLSESQIAAIVLGAFLLLLIIVAIVLVIICCIRRRKKSQDLPYTQRYGSRPPARAERTSF